MRRGEKAQAVLEFAIISPILMLLIFIGLDFGLVLIRQATANDAIRQGATEAAAGVPAATVAAYVAEHSGGILAADAVVVCQPDADHVRVSSQWTWRWISGPLAAWLGHSAVPADVTLHPAADRRIALEPGATPEPLPACP